MCIKELFKSHRLRLINESHMEMIKNKEKKSTKSVFTFLRLSISLKVS